MLPRENTRRIAVLLDMDLYLRVVKYQHRHEFPNMTAAMQALLQIGIDHAKKQGQMAATPAPENEPAAGERRTIVAPKRKQGKKGK
jgi:hypothetical protein